ncbi:TonB-dependent receptor plug domain-containing protein [Asaia prunellae]|uniref:TonB-dependent receptor plug domain-containing protein n=1 Tax=Asaia prunellae TaxID=610245 RepID=UPI001FB14282|nr:TonB-dependent receptor plug domain-containing protein [Asaia prunellae]
MRYGLIIRVLLGSAALCDASIGRVMATEGATASTNKSSSTLAASDAEEIVVTGRQRASTIASSATKSATPLVETAQSVTVITRTDMDLRGVLTLGQALRYTAGITLICAAAPLHVTISSSYVGSPSCHIWTG